VSVGWDDHIRFADPTSNLYNDASALIGQPVGLAASTTVPGFMAVATNTEIAVFRGKDKIMTLTGHGYGATCIAVLGEDEVAVGGDDCKTHVYSLSSGSFVEVAAVQTRSPVSALSYSPLGDVLAIGDAGRQVEVYERGSWAPRVQGRWVFHSSRITTLAWSPDGSRLASGSLDESIIVWTLATVSTKEQLSFAHMGGVTGVDWTDDTHLVSVGNDHTTVMWAVPTSA